MAFSPVETNEIEHEKHLRERARRLERDVLPHAPWLRGWISRRYPAEPDLDDLVQESMEKMLRSTDLAGVRDVRVYLSRTAVRLVVDRARRRRVRALDPRGESGMLDVACANPLPDAVYAAQEEWDAVCRALETLPERTQTVIRMRRLDGMAQREAAHACGLTESSIVKHLRRGLIAVRAELQHTYEGSRE